MEGNPSFIKGLGKGCLVGSAHKALNKKGALGGGYKRANALYIPPKAPQPFRVTLKGLGRVGPFRALLIRGGSMGRGPLSP